VVAPQRQSVVPTMMRQRPEDLPPVRGPGAAWGRWVLGPLLSVAVGAASFFAARALLPKPQKGPAPHPQGRLRLSSDPTGAQITLDGKLYPHFTPTTVEGDVGASLHVSFSLDGYKPKEADLVFGESERAFTARLEKSEAPPAPAPAPAPAPEKPSHKPAKEPKLTGSAKISVHVHPWAIVYVDGNKVHQTPVVDLELPAGKHVIELINEGKNRREKISIVVMPNEPQDLKRDWDQ
jgi:serine/threonine-protein kinase